MNLSSWRCQVVISFLYQLKWSISCLYSNLRVQFSSISCKGGRILKHKTSSKQVDNCHIYWKRQLAVKTASLSDRFCSLYERLLPKEDFVGIQSCHFRPVINNSCATFSIPLHCSIAVIKRHISSNCVFISKTVSKYDLWQACAILLMFLFCYELFCYISKSFKIEL